MVTSIHKVLTVFSIVLLMICQGYSQQSNLKEAEAKQFLNQTSDKLFNFYNQLIDNEFYFDDKMIYNQYSANKMYINFVNKIVQDSKTFDFENFQNEDLKNSFRKLVQIADEKIIGINRYSRILETLKELDFLPDYREISNFTNNNKINLAFSPNVELIFTKSNNEKEIKHYWAAWKKMTGKWANENMIFTIEGLKYAARLSGLSPLEFWLRGFNITDMEEMIWDIQPLYKELHAFVRNQLQKKFGKSLFQSDGLIPDHLFQHIRYQIMTNDSIIEEMFPIDELYSDSDYLIRPNFNAEQFHEYAELFYNQLGFEKYPSNIYSKRIIVGKSEYDYENDEDDNFGDDDNTVCRARVAYKTPNVYLKSCPTNIFYYFYESLQNMGNLYYAKEMVGLPAYFFNSPQGLNEAIGKAVILSASTHDYLRNHAMAWDEDISKKVEMNRLFRMALERLLYLPSDFAYTKVMADLLSGTVEMQDLNKHYWDLMMLYAGVKKPVDHFEDTYDLPYNFYREMNDNLMSRNFTTEILSYQIHKGLCELIGKYPNKKLHLCNINQSVEAGNALKNMMRLGNSKPFYQVLETLFPTSPKVSAEGLLEYYKPLKKMLRKENQRANLLLGWNTSIAY